ncbi:MAG TPA: YlbF family regulator [Bacillota bacterium]|nr:YlbF family regulator [Bacillota bacterium]
MIKQKAAELAAAIKDSEEYKGLQSARARVKLDPKAFDLLNQLQVLQGEIIRLQQQGQPITQAVVEQLRDLENQMQLNLTLRHMVEAQQKFDNLMEEVNAVLAEGLS